MADFIILVQKDEHEPKIIHCNHIILSRTSRTIYFPDEEDEEYLSNEALIEEMHQSFYIAHTFPGKEDDEYLSDKIPSKIDYDDCPGNMSLGKMKTICIFRLTWKGRRIGYIRKISLRYKFRSTIHTESQKKTGLARSHSSNHQKFIHILEQW